MQMLQDHVRRALLLYDEQLYFVNRKHSDYCIRTDDKLAAADPNVYAFNTIESNQLSGLAVQIAGEINYITLCSVQIFIRRLKVLLSTLTSLTFSTQNRTVICFRFNHSQQSHITTSFS